MSTKDERQKRYDDHKQYAADAAASAQGHAPLPGHMNRMDAWNDYRKHLQMARQCEDPKSPDGIHEWDSHGECVHCGVA